MSYTQVATLPPAVTAHRTLDLAAGSAPAARLPVLDGVRGIAILLVMFVHLTVLESTTPADQAFRYVAFLGWIGVDLFFVLSGFLITGILYDAKGLPNYFRNFYVRRVLRIFPLYYLVVVLALVVIPNVPLLDRELSGPIRLEHAWTFWVYLSNFAIAWEESFGSGILIVVWSLAVEEQFYLLWPPVVYALGRRSLMKVCVALIAGAFVLRLVMTAAGVYPGALYVLSVTRMDALAIGGWIALALRSESRSPDLFGYARLVGPLAAAAVIAITVWDRDSTWRGAATQTLGYSCLGLMFGSFLIAALALRPHHRMARILTSPALQSFGKFSYALYLIHLPVRALVRDHIFAPADFPTLFDSQLPGQLLFYPLAILPALGLAWASWHLYEKHFLELKKHFQTTGNRKEAQTPPVVGGIDVEQLRQGPVAVP